MPSTVVPVVTNWGQAVFLALTVAVTDILGFIPKLVGALVILVVGWIISTVVEGLVVRALALVRFNQVAKRAEIDQFLAQAGVQLDPAAVIGKLTYWFLMLIFIGAAFNSFGLTQVNQLINQIIAFIPNVIVAVVVLLLGAIVATFVANLVRGTSGVARIGDAAFLATVARVAVLVFATLIALDQLRIAPAIINTLWMAMAGMVALAGALAFGLGGRDIAQRILEDWYNRSGQMAGAPQYPAQREAIAGPAPAAGPEVSSTQREAIAGPAPAAGPEVSSATHRPAT